MICLEETEPDRLEAEAEEGARASREVPGAVEREGLLPVRGDLVSAPGVGRRLPTR